MTADEKNELKKRHLSRSKRGAETVNLLGQYVLSMGADPTSNLVDSQTKEYLIKETSGDYSEFDDADFWEKINSQCYQHGIEYQHGDVIPKGDGCNFGYYCYLGKIERVYSTLIGCGNEEKDCIKDDKVLIHHLTVFSGDDSCNKCDCFDGKISCTKKQCAMKLQKIHPKLKMLKSYLA